MRIRKNNRIVFIHLLVYVLFLLPSLRLDLFRENYSTLGLNTEGYLFLLMEGILCGALLGYDTAVLSGKRYGMILFASLLMGTIIPHEVPYHIRGNLHLFFAYCGGFALLTITYRNLFYHPDPFLNGLFACGMLLCFLVYLRYMMVNTLLEVILMSVCFYVNFSLYKTKSK